jgi:hypothetical protein
MTSERAHTLDGTELAGHGEQLLLRKVGREAVDVDVWRALDVALRGRLGHVVRRGGRGE